MFDKTNDISQDLPNHSVKAENILEYASEYTPEFKTKLIKEFQQMVDRIEDLEEADRQLVIEQMPQAYVDLKHRLGVLDSMLDNEMCSSSSSAIIKSEYYKKRSREIEDVELDIVAHNAVYEYFTDQNIEEAIKNLSEEE